MSVISVKEADLETTPCPLCNSSGHRPLYSFDAFRMVSCGQCGLIYLNPRLKESVISSVYQGDEYFLGHDNVGYQNYELQERSLRLTFRRFLRELERRGMTSGRLLEIGSGYGYFLDEAKTYYAHISGIELSQSAGSSAQRISGGSVHIGTLGSMPGHWIDFDIIVLFNVIEHIYNPVEFLLSAKPKLRRGGAIVLGTPDAGSFWFKILRKKWPSFKIPEHIALYSKETLSLLLQKTGFKNIREIPFGHAFPLGLILSKLGVNISMNFGTIPIWIPHTIVALSAVNEDG